VASTGSERLFCARGSSVGRFERKRGTARALDHPRMSRDLPLTHRGGQFSLPASVTLPGRGNRGLGRTSMMVSGLRPAMPVPRTGSMQASGLTLRGMTILSCVAIRVSRRAVEMWWAIVSYPPRCWIRRQVGATRKNLEAELCVCYEASEEKIRNYKSLSKMKKKV